MERHNWEEVQGPSSDFKYYRCLVCGVYRAQPVEGKGKSSSWSMIPYGSGTEDEQALDDALDDVLDALDRDYPTCSDVMGVRMGEALE